MLTSQQGMLGMCPASASLSAFPSPGSGCCCCCTIASPHENLPPRLACSCAALALTFRVARKLVEAGGLAAAAAAALIDSSEAAPESTGAPSADQAGKPPSRTETLQHHPLKALMARRPRP